MSHYARLIAPLPVGDGSPPHLPADTEIKCVKLRDGFYWFDAKADGEWQGFCTREDLPSFTDKGSAHRARQVHATLRRGRPLTGEEHVTKPIAFRPTLEQREWMQKHADKKSITISELVRLGLFKLGMPR